MKRLSISVVLVLYWLTLPGQQLPVFDVHLHGHDEKEPVIPTLTRYVNPALGLHQTKTNEELYSKTLRQMERYNIYSLINGSLAQKWHNSMPERFFPGRFIADPSVFNADEVRQEIKDGKWFAIGEIVSQYLNMAPDDPALKPVFDLAEEMDVPVGIHIGMGPPGGNLNGESNFRNSAGRPLQLENVLITHPKLRVYMMHAGWPMLDETLYMLYLYPQLYVDIALIDWAIPRKEFYYYLGRLVNAGFGDRIMFGSDQMVWPESIELAIQAVNSAEFLTESQKRDILYNNAARFFGFSEETKRSHLITKR